MQQLAWVAVILTLPVILLLRITEPRHVTIKRLKRSGHTWEQIGKRYGKSTSTVRRWSCPAGGV